MSIYTEGDEFIPDEPYIALPLFEPVEVVSMEQTIKQCFFEDTNSENEDLWNEHKEALFDDIWEAFSNYMERHVIKDYSFSEQTQKEQQ